MKYTQQKIPTNKKKRKTNNHHFSTKTGTKSRSKPKDKILDKIKKIHKNKCLIKINFIQNFLEGKYETIIKELNYLKSIRGSKFKTIILKSIIQNLELSDNYDFMRKRIDRTLDNEIIMELNKDKLQKLNKNLYTLILSLNRINLPDDLIELITNEGLKLIVPETNIYKIIPDNLLIDIQIVDRIEREYYNSLQYYYDDVNLMNKRKKELLEKYSTESEIYYEFVECILMNKRKKYIMKYKPNYGLYNRINRDSLNDSFIYLMQNLMDF